jgi:nicotinamide-nucleotide amidase
MNAEIIAVGSELLTPFRQDTNSLYLTAKLNSLGVRVDFKTIAGDRRKHLVDAIHHALGRVDIVVITGGLGPTEDDLTREAAAEALEIRLRRNQEIVAGLYARFAARRIQITDNNTKQADILEGAAPLPNAQGTAPGQYLDTVHNGHRKLLFLLPGPPVELKAMWEAEASPRLAAVVPPRAIATRTLKAAMIGESIADARVAPIYKSYTDVETTILAHLGDITFSLACSKPTQAEAQKRVDQLAHAIEEELDDVVYSTNGDSLERVVLYNLELRRATLATAESCTGGLVAQRLTAIPGSSRSFVGGAVTYSNELKTTFAGVDPALIDQHGAVSAEVARAMAEGMRAQTGASHALAITGIAGPGGATADKPVGLVYLALSSEDATEVVEKNFSGDRERVRAFSAHQGLDMVRRALTQHR